MHQSTSQVRKLIMQKVKDKFFEERKKRDLNKISGFLSIKIDPKQPQKLMFKPKTSKNGKSKKLFGNKSKSGLNKIKEETVKTFKIFNNKTRSSCSPNQRLTMKKLKKLTRNLIVLRKSLKPIKSTLHDPTNFSFSKSSSLASLPPPDYTIINSANAGLGTYKCSFEKCPYKTPAKSTNKLFRQINWLG
ncbi:unnamed protein product [Moneuplotes crassus]|uniref:Uncharacterized protein n=1 Tax=Euplotes crassus TaxID=5936 RepID=A0AAD1ULV4_EUPCR|nr:unnamed protein product [Moneuplotes crassus]